MHISFIINRVEQKYLSQMVWEPQILSLIFSFWKCMLCSLLNVKLFPM